MQYGYLTSNLVPCRICASTGSRSPVENSESTTTEYRWLLFYTFLVRYLGQFHPRLPGKSLSLSFWVKVGEIKGKVTRAEQAHTILEFPCEWTCNETAKKNV